MADGGFVVKIDGKELCRCYSIAFDYDDWAYTANDAEPKPLPPDAETITVEAAT